MEIDKKRLSIINAGLLQRFSIIFYKYHTPLFPPQFFFYNASKLKKVYAGTFKFNETAVGYEHQFPN